MQVDATVFTCISMLARAMGPGIQQDIKELLEPMLAVGLRWVSETSAFPVSGRGMSHRIVTIERARHDCLHAKLDR